MKEFIKLFFKDFFYALGIAWLAVKLVIIYYPNLLWPKESFVFYLLIGLSCLFSFLRNYPTKKIKLLVPGSAATLIIEYGDILKSKNNIVITTSNFFNTSLSVISENSILGQYILRNLSGNSSRLDSEIVMDLSTVQGTLVNPIRGKNISYPVGTVACFNTNNNKVGFLMAILKIEDIGGNETVVSNYFDLLSSLEHLWDKIALKANDGVVDMPAIGSGIARNFGRSFDSVLFIAYSFIIRARNKRPCSTMRILLRRSDLPLNDYMKLKEAIKYLI